MQKRFRIFLFLAVAAIFTACGPSDEEKGLVLIETEYGNIKIRLYEDTPLHKENFLKNVREGKYDGSIFHRVIPQFMVQGGDFISGDGMEGGGMPDTSALLPNEINPAHVHTRGVIAAARMGDQVNPQMKSSSAQFYIVTGKAVTAQELDMMQEQIAQIQRRSQWINWQFSLPKERQEEIIAICQQSEDSCMQVQNEMIQEFEAAVPPPAPFKYTEEQRQKYLEQGGFPSLDMQYTVFGEVVEGMDVVDRISNVKRDQGDKPLEDIVMNVKVIE